MTGRFALALLTTALAACSGGHASDPVIDGWPIGSALSCDASQRCPELLATASTGLDDRDPGHAAVVKVELHREGVTVDADGNVVLWTRSGTCCSVARFELADGSVKAIGVGFPGVSTTPMAFDYGP